MTQEELASAAKLSLSTIQKAEASLSSSVRGSTYRSIAKALGMTPVELDNAWRSSGVPQQIGDSAGGIPLLSEVPAGRGDFDPTDLGFDNGLGMGYIPRAAAPGVTDPLAYALIVRGDSMEPRLYDGMTVICSPHEPHESGKVYAIRFGSELDNECTIKQVYDLGDGSLLIAPANPRHKPRTVNREHIVRMDRVIKVITDLD